MEDDENPSVEEQKVNIKVVYPEPPKDFDRAKYADEFEKYEPSNVADLMYQRKERKIPGSVLKPHSNYTHLVYSDLIVGQKLVRVLFPYPQYCFKLKTTDSFLVHQDLQQQILNSDE